MPLRIRLLGQPVIEAGDRPRPLPGWKPWGLLAYLVLADRPASRQELAELLWPGADDPAGALRWALFQLRRALEPEAAITPRGGFLELERGAISVDVIELLEGSVASDRVEDVARGGLIETLHFDGAPAFELWLGIERSRIDSALRSTLRWAATLSASHDADRALRLVERALALDPFDDAAHELAIEVHALRGDRRAAEAHLRRVVHLYRTELGIEAPERIRRPFDRLEPVIPNPLIDLVVSSRALTDMARVRLATGDYDASISAARRAAAAAAAAGESLAETNALCVLAEGLIHGRRGHDAEAVGLLDRALRLATDAGAHDLAADIELEAGYVAFLRADYGASETAFNRSLAVAQQHGDRGRAGRALTLLAACRSDEGALDTAEALLHRAVAELDAAGDRRWGAYARAHLSRNLLAMLRADDARLAAELAIGEARATGWTALLPFPMASLGESLLGSGDPESAQAVLGEALTMSEEMGDPCWEALALRGLGRIEFAAGRTTAARSLMTQALERCRRVPDTYRWAEIAILTDLVELESGADATRRDDARRMAHRAGMHGFVRRIDSAGRQTDAQTAVMQRAGRRRA